MDNSHILLTGCSGGGKSTLLTALNDRGFATVPEPGRRIVAEELAGAGAALPWVDMKAFALRALDMAKRDLDAACHLPSPVFFDRGLIDAVVALAYATGQPTKAVLGDLRPYAQRVFVTPPWEAIFKQDIDRQHDFDAAVAEYQHINAALDDLGYSRIELPRSSVQERVETVLENLG